jgi:hypothetical protein
MKLLVAALALLAPAAALAGEMKDELKFDATRIPTMRTTFAVYPSTAIRSIFADGGGLRFQLPDNVPKLPQTGLYTLFTLSGDCEVTFTYEILKLPPPKDGYGSGLGVAFDLGDDMGKGVFQRVIKPPKDIGYIVQFMPGKLSKTKEEYKLVPSATLKGGVGLRRVKKELIFLASDDPDAPLEEIGRLPFPEVTVREVRFYADTGGAQTPVDVRMKDFSFKAEQITGGVPRSEVRRWSWWFLLALVPLAGVGLVIWRWRVYRRNAEG